MLDHSCQVRRHPLTERKDDFYETPVAAVHVLLRVEPLLQQPRNIWEPACGRGAIVNPLRAAGHRVIASDLVDYGVPITALSRTRSIHARVSSCSCGWPFSNRIAAQRFSKQWLAHNTGLPIRRGVAP